MRLITDFNEGLAYLWHYEYFEIECLGKNEGRLQSALQETKRWNPHHIAYAIKLSPLVDRYREEGKSMDADFFIAAKAAHEKLKAKKPELFTSPPH
ncbi:hypothetical protein KKB83_05625 [Patescibacteria group bacterium]|nr:hypothetical protein [Patescibacteria group bacterium]